MWNYKNGLPPLEKPILKKPVEFEPYNEIYNTDIDGFPYFLIITDRLQYTDKFVVANSTGLYSLKSYNEKKKTITTKLEKTLDISNRQVVDVQAHLAAWGMKKESEKVKVNYRWGNIEFNIEGKLSKNQTIQFKSFFVKIKELIKKEDGVIDFDGEIIDYNIIAPVYPHRENNEIIEWYYDMQDVWLRQVKEIKK